MWSQNSFTTSQYPVSGHQAPAQPPSHFSGNNAISDWASKAAQWAQQKQLDDRNQAMQQQSQLSMQWPSQHYPQYQQPTYQQPNQQYQPTPQPNYHLNYQATYQPSPYYQSNPTQQNIPQKQPTPLIVTESVGPPPGPAAGPPVGPPPGPAAGPPAGPAAGSPDGPPPADPPPLPGPHILPDVQHSTEMHMQFGTQSLPSHLPHSNVLTPQKDRGVQMKQDEQQSFHQFAQSHSGTLPPQKFGDIQMKQEEQQSLSQFKHAPPGVLPPQQNKDVQMKQEQQQSFNQFKHAHSGLLPPQQDEDIQMKQEEQQSFKKIHYAYPSSHNVINLKPLASETSGTPEVQQIHVHHEDVHVHSSISPLETVEDAEIALQHSKSDSLEAMPPRAEFIDSTRKETQTPQSFSHSDNVLESSDDREINPTDTGKEYERDQVSLLTTRDRYKISNQKVIPGLDLVVKQDDTKASGKYLNRDPQRPHLQNLSCVGNESSQMIDSLGKIVSQLKALNETHVNVPKVTGKYMYNETQDEATRKVAALLENESDSEGDEDAEVKKSVPISLNESREFQGFGSTPNAYHDHHGGNLPMHRQHVLIPDNPARMEGRLPVKGGTWLNPPDYSSYNYDRKHDHPFRINAKDQTHDHHPIINPEYQTHNHHPIINPEYRAHDHSSKINPEYQIHNRSSRINHEYQSHDHHPIINPEYQSHDRPPRFKPGYQTGDHPPRVNPEYQTRDHPSGINPEYQTRERINPEYQTHDHPSRIDPEYQTHFPAHDCNPGTNPERQTRDHPPFINPEYETHDHSPRVNHEYDYNPRINPEYQAHDHPPRINPEHDILVNPDFHQQNHPAHDTCVPRMLPRDQYHYEDDSNAQPPNNSNQRISPLYDAPVTLMHDRFSSKVSGRENPSHQQPYFDEDFLNQNSQQTTYEHQSYDYEPIPQKDQAAVSSNSSILMMNLQSVDYDHGRVLKTSDDVQSKNLPNWLRKELEELELKRIKDDENERNFEKSKKNQNFKSWTEDLTDDEDKELDVKGSLQYHNERKNDTDSVLQEYDQKLRREIEREDTYEERQVEMITRVRQMLTEVLLEVTNHEMLEVVHEVMESQGFDQASSALIPGLSIYSSPSDFNNFSEDELIDHVSQVTDNTLSSLNDTAESFILSGTEQFKEVLEKQHNIENVQTKKMQSEVPKSSKDKDRVSKHKDRVSKHKNKSKKSKRSKSDEYKEKAHDCSQHGDLIDTAKYKSMHHSKSKGKERSRSELLKNTCKSRSQSPSEKHRNTRESRKTTTHKSKSGSHKDTPMSSGRTGIGAHRDRSGSRNDTHRSRSRSREDHRGISGSRKSTRRSRSRSHEDHRGRSGSRQDTRSSTSGHRDSHKDRIGSRMNSRRRTRSISRENHYYFGSGSHEVKHRDKTGLPKH